jgi:hypothetical protein
MASNYSGRWEMGIGDPTAMGWVTVAAYAATMWLCYRCKCKATDTLTMRFWFFMALTMGLLAINKQLDLQTWVTQTGRDLAFEYGWYERRRVVQVVFIVWLALVGLVLHARLVVWVRALDRHARLASMGLVLLGVFVVVRAVSFHHVDELLGFKIESVNMNVLLELSGIGVVARAAMSRLRVPRTKLKQSA